MDAERSESVPLSGDEHWRFVIDTVLVRSVLDRLTYLPGWRFGLSGPDRLFLMAWVDDTDSRTGEPREGSVRRMPIDWPRDTLGQPPALNTEDGVVAWVRHALHEWAAHEVNEWLRLDGEIVHDPHACRQCLVGGCRA